jgi:hypothetical protein
LTIVAIEMTLSAGERLQGKSEREIAWRLKSGRGVPPLHLEETAAGRRCHFFSPKKINGICQQIE